MSHVAVVKMNKVTSLSAIKEACKRLGLEFREGQKTYKWFGRWVNDYSASDAAYKATDIDPKDYGKCDHAIGVPGNKNAYEIGLVKDKNGEGYHMVWDFWSGGFGLEAKVGPQAQKLADAYILECGREELIEMGASDIHEENVNGQLEYVGYMA